MPATLPLLPLKLFLAALLLVPQTAQPQHAATGERPAFEAAAVRAVDPTSGDKLALDSGFQLTPGRFSARNKTMRELIEFAYDIRQSSEDKITGGPASVLGAHYTITASLPMQQNDSLQPETENQQARLMLQSLLAERFHLKLHTVQKEVSVQALVQTKSGSRLVIAPLREGETEGTRRSGLKGGRGVMIGVAATTDDLVNALAKQPEVNSHLIANQTELKDRYNFELRWTSEQGGPTQQDDASGPSLFTALREQLGLQLVSGKATMEIFVIDQAERPTQN